MKAPITVCLFSFLSVSLTCSAGFKSFEAPLDESKWLYSGTPLNCKLTHKIPFYGDAAFEKKAGKEQFVDFKLGYKRQEISGNKTAVVRAIAPAWQPQQPSRLLGEVSLNSGAFLIDSQNIASWKLLNELEIGRFPTFFYQEFNETEDQVAVSLSSVGFQFEYDKFLDCLTSLVPYKLEELLQMTLYFDFDKFSVPNNDQSKLSALAAYIKYDPSIDVVLIQGYTDSKGSRYYNEKLAEKRVQSVKKSLTLDGVDGSRFKTQAFGEKYPVASNRNANGRAKNRRVYIKIAQL